jgi:phosphoribosyl-ATP pyrophosphohydrolase
MIPASDAAVLARLYRLILDRKDADPATSHTAALWAKGTAKMAKKLGEEAVEAAIAAVQRQPAEVVKESADLLYHLLVVWADAGVKPEDVYAELARREGTSGIDEKRSRPR